LHTEVVPPISSISNSCVVSKQTAILLVVPVLKSACESSALWNRKVNSVRGLSFAWSEVIAIEACHSLIERVRCHQRFPYHRATTVAHKTLDVMDSTSPIERQAIPSKPKVLFSLHVSILFHQYLNLIPALADRFHSCSGLSGFRGQHLSGS